jgi:nickel-type superoxide dismutase maturation protease
MLRIIKVTGKSLSPFFLPGDFVLVRKRTLSQDSLSSGSVVVFDHPVYGRLIKRVLSNDTKSKTLIVGGEHKDSISSHKLGPIPYSSLIGKVIFHIKKPR